MSKSHLVIPDLQCAPGRSTKHHSWINQLIREWLPDRVIQLGDLWDYPSLSSHDEGKYKMSSRRISADEKAGNTCVETLMSDVPDTVRWYFTEGNHENRIDRYLSANPKHEGRMPDPVGYLNELGWKAGKFLEPITLDGITYCHFFPVTSKGTTSLNAQRNGATSAKVQLDGVGSSCIAGHKQGLEYAEKRHALTGRRVRSIIAGSCYLHNETYMPLAFQKYWRGVLWLENVSDGDYDLYEININTLRKWYG